MEDVLDLLKLVEKTDEFFTLTARVMKKMHSALVNEGFTHEEATQIVASQGGGVKTS